MKTASVTTTVPLAYQTTMHIPDPAGLEITCTEGLIWLTLDGDLRDIILTASTAEATFITTEHRAALLYALKDSQIAVAARHTQAVRTQHAQVHMQARRDDAHALLPLVPA